MWQNLQGWKFHGVAVGFILCCLIEKVAGLDIPDFDPGDNWVMLVFGALAGMAGRSTVKAVTGK